MGRLARTLLVSSTLILSWGAIFSLMPVKILADAQDDVCETIGVVDGSQSNDCRPTDTDKSINDLITSVVNVLSFAIGVAAVIMIMIGGFKYVTSSGDSNGAQSAKNTIIYGVVGLVIAALAQAIVIFALSRIE